MTTLRAHRAPCERDSHIRRNEQTAGELKARGAELEDGGTQAIFTARVDQATITAIWS